MFDAAAVARLVDSNKKTMSLLRSMLLILVPWMQISKAVMSDVAVSVPALLTVLAAGIGIHLVFLAFNLVATAALQLGRSDKDDGAQPSSRLSSLIPMPRMCLVCASYVPRMFLVCASYVPRMFLVCASYVPRGTVPGMLGLHQMYARRCTPYVALCRLYCVSKGRVINAQEQDGMIHGPIIAMLHGPLAMAQYILFFTVAFI